MDHIMQNVTDPLMKLADMQKQLAEMTVRNEFQTKLMEQEMTIKLQDQEVQKLRAELMEKNETISRQNKQIEAIMVQNTAMALRELWRMGRFIMSTEKMREQFRKCLMANDGHSAYIMMNFAENASYYELTDEDRHFIEEMVPRNMASINFNGTVNNNGGTLTGDITHENNGNE